MDLIRKRNFEVWDDQHLQAESLRLQEEARSGTPLDDLLVDAYALVCEVAKRTLGGSNDPEKWEQFGLKSPISTRTYMINDQYSQDKRSSWTGTTVFAYWGSKMLKLLLRPINRMSK